MRTSSCAGGGCSPLDESLALYSTARGRATTSRSLGSAPIASAGPREPPGRALKYPGQGGAHFVGPTGNPLHHKKCGIAALGHLRQVDLPAALSPYELAETERDAAEHFFEALGLLHVTIRPMTPAVGRTGLASITVKLPCQRRVDTARPRLGVKARAWGSALAPDFPANPFQKRKGRSRTAIRSDQVLRARRQWTKGKVTEWLHPIKARTDSQRSRDPSKNSRKGLPPDGIGSDASLQASSSRSQRDDTAWLARVWCVRGVPGRKPRP